MTSTVAALNVAGIDPSTTRTGYVSADGTILSICPRDLRGEPVRKRHEVRNKLSRAIRTHPPLPDLVVIEGYSIASPSRWALVHRGELGGMLRDVLYDLGIPWVEIPPKSLKLFATGKGDAKKDMMIYAANSIIMHDGDVGQKACANDDEADAFHLRRMGRVAHNLEPARAPWETEAIEKCGADW